MIDDIYLDIYFCIIVIYIYYDELAHTIMYAEQSHSLPSTHLETQERW